MPSAALVTGTDPHGSVIDPHGKVHGFDGLYVGDGSVLPRPLGSTRRSHSAAARLGAPFRQYCGMSLR